MTNDASPSGSGIVPRYLFGPEERIIEIKEVT